MADNWTRYTATENLCVRPISHQDGEDVYLFLQTIGSNEYDFKNDVYGISFEEYEVWRQKQIDWSTGINLPYDFVPQTTYLLFANDIPIGLGKIRWGLTEQSREAGGNIGYAVGKAHRGKGYGKILFSALMHIGKENGLTEIIATVTKPNYASKAVIEKCGGKLFRETEARWYFDVSSE